MIKAILLLSGGLDSVLAGKMLLEMGVSLRGLNTASPFCRCTPRSLGCSAAVRAAGQLGISVKVVSGGKEYLELMKRPRFGRGSGMNACIDCRIHLFSHARTEMEAWDADFIATGEVLDERPMSQRRKTLELIDRESGLEGYILRPLSAKLLPPTVPEQKGLVCREQLRAIQGRRRIPQFELAKELGITEYLCPGGGCLLTDPEYAERFRDLLSYAPDFGMEDVNLLKIGRHFRLESGAKVVVGRNEAENTAIEGFLAPGDIFITPSGDPGPSVLCRDCVEDDRELAAALAAVFTGRGSQADFQVQRIREDGRRETAGHSRRTMPLTRKQAAQWWVGTDHSRLHMAQETGKEENIEQNIN
ncbi:MAG: hypothetical protein ACYC9O_04960 [Candidatus Latescibacterota bacterium]